MASQRFFSLQTKFILISVINAIIPLVLIVGLSYTKSIELVTGQVSRSNLNTVEQVSDNIDLVFQDMENSSVYLLQNREFMDYLRLPKSDIRQNPGHQLSVQRFIHNYLAFNTRIHSIYLEAFNGLVFDSASASNTIPTELRKQLLLLRGGGIMMTDSITDYKGRSVRVFSYIKMIKDTENLSANLAILKVNILETEISDVFGGKLLSANSNYLIIDDQNTIISSLDEAQIGTPLAAAADSRLFNGSAGYFNKSIDRNEYTVFFRDLAFSGWKLVNLAPLKELSQDITVIRNITLLSITLSIAFCIFTMLSFAVRTLRPLRLLRRATTQIQNENFKVSLPVSGNDEVALLTASFNRMSAKLDELVNEVLAVQIKQKEAELKALQAQINPHFLYNTLDMIYWTSKLEHAEESAKLIQTLSKLFRLSLNSGNEFTTLKSEVEHLKLYLTIQQKRFQDAVQFTVEADERLFNCKVVKLVLQPLVENAILHGLEKNGGKGRVDIRIVSQGDTLLYTIEDNGAGAVQSEVYAYLEKPRESEHGFAISNVNDRIRIYYGSGYGLAFKTAPGEGMTVTVTQPLITDTQSQ